MSNKGLKRRSDTERNVFLNFYTPNVEAVDREAVLDLFERIAKRLSADFPKIYGEMLFAASVLMDPISDATPEYNTHTTGRWSYIRLAAVEMENSLPQYREEILSDRCSRYDLADMPHNGKKTDFTCFISQQYKNETYDYTVGAHLTMRPEIYRESYENEWIAICHQFAEAFSAVGGFCTYADYFNYGSYVRTPLETLTGNGRYDPVYHEKQCTTSLNGYHWGVLLTEEHIRRLGGVERILKEAPCYKKHLWSIGGKDAIFLQATESIFDFPAEKRLELKSFLQPILPETDPLKAAVEETLYKGSRMDTIVFSPEERAQIDALEKRYTPQELNRMDTEKHASEVPRRLSPLAMMSDLKIQELVEMTCTGKAAQKMLKKLLAEKYAEINAQNVQPDENVLIKQEPVEKAAPVKEKREITTSFDDLVDLRGSFNTSSIEQEYNQLVGNDNGIPVMAVPSESVREAQAESAGSHDGSYSTYMDTASKEALTINTAKFFRQRRKEYEELLTCEDDFEEEVEDAGMAEEALLYLIPDKECWKLPLWFPMGGFNECPTPEEQAAVFKKWHEEYGAVPYYVSEDTWKLRVERLPSRRDIHRLAKEQLLFCIDLLALFPGGIKQLEEHLLKSDVWTFWWD